MTRIETKVIRGKCPLCDTVTSERYVLNMKGKDVSLQPTSADMSVCKDCWRNVGLVILAETEEKNDIFLGHVEGCTFDTENGWRCLEGCEHRTKIGEQLDQIREPYV